MISTCSFHACHRARRPANAELTRLLDRLSRRIVHVLERRGLLIADPVDPYLEYEPGSSLDQLQAASIQYRIAIGPHAGRKALTLYSVPPLEAEPSVPLLARMYGLSLHAGTVCEAHQRSKIETCPDCGGKLRVIACIEDPQLIHKILGHVRQRDELTGIEARGPPGEGVASARRI